MPVRPSLLLLSILQLCILGCKAFDYSSMHFRIEYYNDLWKDWLDFDQTFYKTKEQARKRIDEYKESVPDFQTRIIQTTILDEKPKRARKQNTQSVRVERP